jgi:GH25 family lysozyme M1 (1,4-beta-N-acetylmuramidase)
MTEIVFDQYPLRGIDVSVYNDNPNTPQGLDFQKAKDAGVKFVLIRSSYGIVTDGEFIESWASAKGLFPRGPYHYMDYYSHLIKGISDLIWGQQQAEKVYSLVKDDNDNTITWLDIEKASMAPKIEDVIDRVRRIASAFLARMDQLNGKLNGLYLSLSYLKFFLGFKNRPLWLALYNEDYTPESAIAAARAMGWTGPIYIWQYASDGDTGTDGIGDGIRLGMEAMALDLNIWLGTEQEFNDFWKVTVTPPPVPTEPKTRVVPMGKTLVNGQSLRKAPNTSATIVDKLIAGREVELLGFAKDALGNTWYRLGPDLWAAKTYGGTRFIEPLYE